MAVREREGDETDVLTDDQLDMQTRRDIAMPQNAVDVEMELASRTDGRTDGRVGDGGVCLEQSASQPVGVRCKVAD